MTLEVRDFLIGRLASSDGSGLETAVTVTKKGVERRSISCRPCSATLPAMSSTGRDCRFEHTSVSSKP